MTLLTRTVILTLKHLKNANYGGSDGISLHYLRDSLPVIIHYLTTIINTSIVRAYFPFAWKHAMVTPIFKSGDHNNVKNYRPISLSPILSKVLGKKTSPNSFLESNQILSKTQHGFRPQLSPETVPITLTNKLCSHMDNKKLSLATLLDLSNLLTAYTMLLFWKSLLKFR